MFSVTQEEPLEDLQNVASGHLGADFYGQCLAGVFVEHGQHLVRATVAISRIVRSSIQV